MEAGPNSNLKKALKFVNTISNSKSHLATRKLKDEGQQQVRGVNYVNTSPSPLKQPRIVALSKPCMDLIGLTPFAQDPQLAEYLVGNKIFEGSQTMAHCYCGHQFGVFAGQLGDGRAISLGDIQGNHDHQAGYGEFLDLQLKGAGKTPFSRSADGRAVFRSSLREFLCSEYMWALGIPTTRAASLVITNSTVARDKLYTGNIRQEPCAVVMRVAPNFMRFGSFEIFKETDKYSGRQGPSVGMEQSLQPRMINYLVDNFYAQEINRKSINEKGQQMFEIITKRTAETVALWQCFGFCHGVLNTDNLSIMGLTIDYGPYAWMENFDPNFICNHSDQPGGRYRYKAQPDICKWNLQRLAEALHPTVDVKNTMDYVNNNFDNLYKKAYYTKMGQKLGFLITKPPSKDAQQNGMFRLNVDPNQQFRELTKNEIRCIDSLFEVMTKTHSDMTDTFRLLSSIGCDLNDLDPILKSYSEICAPPEIVKKINTKQEKYSPEEMMKIEQILQQQPDLLYVFGIDPNEARKDLEEFKKKKNQPQNILSQGNMEQIWKEWIEKYQSLLQKTPEWKELGDEYDKVRQESMNNRANPAFMLRNYQMEESITAVERNSDDSKVHQLLESALNPFMDIPKKIHPIQRYDICISCSS